MPVVAKLFRLPGAGRGQDEPSARGRARRVERALAFEDAPPGAVRRLGGDRVPAPVRLVAGALVDEERFDPTVAVHVDERDLGLAGCRHRFTGRLFGPRGKPATPNNAITCAGVREGCAASPEPSASAVAAAAAVNPAIHLAMNPPDVVDPSSRLHPPGSNQTSRINQPPAFGRAQHFAACLEQ